MFFLLLFASLSLLFVASCGKDPSAEKAKKEMREASDAMGDVMKKERDELKVEISDAQQQIDRRLDQMRSDLKSAKQETKANLQKDIDRLEMKRKQLAEDLEQLEAKADTEWDQFKANVRQTIQDIGGDAQ